MATYSKEILENLKNLNYASNQNRETAVRGFEGLQSAISEAAELQREEIAAARDAVVGSIDKLSYDLGYKLDEVNRNLFNIDSTLQITNQLLHFIGNELSDIRKLITIPNEVQALELADQARINIALGKKKEALEITTRAMSLCSTSIPVTAYHILSHTVQEDDRFEAVKSLLVDYGNLVAFKLQDKASRWEDVMSSINTMTYPVLNAVGGKYGAAVLEPVKSVYSAIAVLKEAKVSFFRKGLWDDQLALMVNGNTILRELHWCFCYDILVQTCSKESTIEDAKDFAKYIVRLDESNSPCTPELQKAMTSYFSNHSRLTVGFVIEGGLPEKRALDLLVGNEQVSPPYVLTLVLGFYERLKISPPSDIAGILAKHGTELKLRNGEFQKEVKNVMDDRFPSKSL